MPDLVGLALQSDVTVPSSTGGQRALAIVVTIVLVLGVVIAYRRSAVLGLDTSQRETREEVRAQRRRQTPTELKLPTDTVAGLSAHELRTRVDALLDRDAESTITRLPGAAKRTYTAVSRAWANRVGWLPALARRAVGVAAAVVVFGAVAVSAEAVVRLLQTDPDAPNPGSVAATLRSGVGTGQDVVATYPFAGDLWQLAYAGAIIGAQWLYGEWVLVASALVVSAVSLVLLDRRLDAESVPDRLVASRRLATGTVLVSVVAVWLAGAVPVAVGSVVGTPTVAGLAVPALVGSIVCVGVAFLAADGRGYRAAQYAGLGFLVAAIAGGEWAAVAGLWLSLGVAIGVVLVVGPHASRRVRRGIRQVAGADARAAAAMVVLQRGVATLSIVAGLLVVVYAIAGVTGGQWTRVIQAATSAPPETQALLGAALAGVGALAALSVRESWADVREEVNSALTQQAIRLAVIRRGVPWVGVFFAYALATQMLDGILPAMLFAGVVGLALYGGLTVVDEAEYRADWQSIWRRLFVSKPSFVAIRAYRVDVDGREAFLVAVNSDRFLHVDRDRVVADVVTHAQAVARREGEPPTDSREFAGYVLDHGIADPEAWEAKLDEKIRKAALNPFRNTGLPIIGTSNRRVARETFESQFEDFEDARVRRRLNDPDLARCLDRREQFVELRRDPYGVDDADREWPSLSD
ncbi:MAG: hypothetical protein ACOCQV_02805 [Halolamina sp.]